MAVTLTNEEVNTMIDAIDRAVEQGVLDDPSTIVLGSIANSLHFKVNFPTEKAKSPDSFTTYLLEFYGPNGIYDYGFTVNQITVATELYKSTLGVEYPGQEFLGDSVDRERVRDIILAKYYPELV